MTYECAAYRLPDDALMVTAQQTLVLIDLEERRPAPVPDQLRAAIRTLEGGTSTDERSPHRGAQRVVGEGTDADEILRSTVATLAAEPDVSWAGISFLEDGELALGPSAGHPDEARRTTVTIVSRRLRGELSAD